MQLFHNVNIEVYNTCIRLCGYELGDHPDLEKFFTVLDKISQRYIPKCMNYDNENKILTIPRGIDIDLLEKYFNTKAEYKTDSTDPYDTGLTFRLSYAPRDDVQKCAVKFIIGANEYASTKKEPQLGVNLNTGAGKTYVTICASTILGLRTIMITSSIGWIKQWQERIMEYTDTTPTEIYPIVGSTSIALIEKGMVDVSKIKYFLASHQTLHYYASSASKDGKEDWSKVTELFKKLRVGLKVYDEAHLEFDNIWKIDSCTNTYKSLYLTATPARSANDEDVIYQAMFKNTPRIDLFDESRDRRTRYISLLYTSHPSIGQVNYCNTIYGFDKNHYCNYIAKNEYFYKVLTIIIEIILKTQSKTLIYIGTNKLIKIVKKWIDENYPYLSDKVGIYTSITEKSIKEDQLNKLIILSTTKSCGAAIDIKHLQLTVVLAEPFKSKVLARQSLGRTRDKDTTYIEIVDTGFDAIYRCYQLKLPLFEKYATSVTESHLSKNVINPSTHKFEIDESSLEENYNAALKAKLEREKK